MYLNQYGFNVNMMKGVPKPSEFYLHNHNEHEIYVFFEGDVKYVVEEKNYALSSEDIIIIRKQEMHRVYHNNPKPYYRIVIMVSPEFFVKNNCPEYESAFLEDNFSKGNRISAEVVRESGLRDAIVRLGKYTDNFKNTDTNIANSIMVEILHIINAISSFEKPDAVNKTVKKIIEYINENFASDISLDALCEQFFISKYHLCRVFKQATGLTVQMYIKQKRLTLVDELVAEGKSLSDASAIAGFNNYSSFYRTCEKVYKNNPRSAPFNKHKK